MGASPHSNQFAEVVYMFWKTHYTHAALAFSRQNCKYNSTNGRVWITCACRERDVDDLLMNGWRLTMEST